MNIQDLRSIKNSLYPYREARCTAMLAIGLALLCALAWVAVSYPVPGDQARIETVRLSDRYWLVRHKFHRTLKGMHYGEGTISESLLDDQSGRLTKVRRFLHRGRFQTDYEFEARPLADGRLFWREPYGDNGVTIFDMATRKRIWHGIKLENSIFVGNRFLIRASGHASGQQIESVDLLAEHPQVQRWILTDPVTANTSVSPHAIPNSNCFYLVFDFYRSDGKTNPVPIFDPTLLQPPPLSVFAREVQWLILFEQNQTGPVKLAAWPVVGGSRTTVCAGKNWICSLSLDGSKIDCRKASTGEVIRELTVPAANASNISSIQWSVDGDTLQFASVAGISAPDPIDLTSGQRIPISGIYGDRILAREGNRYLALEPFDFSLQVPWPPWFQVREIGSSKPIVRFPLPADDCYFDGDFAGTQIRMKSESTRIYCVDIPSGKVARIIDPYLWARRLGSVIVAAAWLWIFIWIRTCFQMQASPFFCFGIITFGSVAFLGLRLAGSGDAWVIERIAWQLLLGIALAWTPVGLVCIWRKTLRFMRGKKRFPQFSLSSILITMVVCELLIAWAGQIRSLYWIGWQNWLHVAVWVTVGLAAQSLMAQQTRPLFVRCLLIVSLATAVTMSHATLSGVWQARPAFWLSELWYPACSIYCVALTNTIGAYRRTEK